MIDLLLEKWMTALRAQSEVHAHTPPLSGPAKTPGSLP
jgi:hypothetical protein